MKKKWRATCGVNTREHIGGSPYSVLSERAGRYRRILNIIHFMASNGRKMEFWIAEIPLIAQEDLQLGRWLNRFQIAPSFQRNINFWDIHWIIVPPYALWRAMTVENGTYMRTFYRSMRSLFFM